MSLDLIRIQKPNAFGLAKDVVLNRHQGGSHYAYVDGHVKWGTTTPPFGPISKPKPATRRRVGDSSRN